MEAFFGRLAQTGSSRCALRSDTFIQAYSGVFHMLPLGLRVQEKLERLIDRHMNSLGMSLRCRLVLYLTTDDRRRCLKALIIVHIFSGIMGEIGQTQRGIRGRYNSNHDRSELIDPLLDFQISGQKGVSSPSCPDPRGRDNDTCGWASRILQGRSVTCLSNMYVANLFTRKYSMH